MLSKDLLRKYWFNITIRVTVNIRISEKKIFLLIHNDEKYWLILIMVYLNGLKKRPGCLKKRFGYGSD